MDGKIGSENYILRWRWPAIAIIVLCILAGIQLIRVNRSPRPTTVAEVVPYSTPGALLSGNVSIPGSDYYSARITLNRRAKLTGDFKTGHIKSRVSVLVMTEYDFERWKLDAEHSTVVKTGYVPGGKISPVLEPGTYFLVIDNRVNEAGLTIHADFVLD